MKALKWISLLSLAVFMVGLIACGGGGGKYSDLKPLVKKYNQETEKFISAMENADNAKKVAAALTEFSQAMKQLKPKMDKITKMGELMMKMGSVMMKAMQYADDPEVKKAQEEFEKAFK